MVRGLPFPPEDLKTVATAFVELQEARHEADYDTGQRFVPREVEAIVKQAEEAFQAWRRTRSTPLARTYLIALLVARNWGRE